jgi:DnaJ homolog subfamily C member 11
MTEDADNGAHPILSAAFGAAPQHESSENFSTSREEYIFGEDDVDDDQDSFGPSWNQLNSYPNDVDYYAVLGLSRNPPPSDAQIRSAFHLLSPSFHPDKHAGVEQQARAAFEKLEDAYTVLIDPQKRAVYDLLGKEGVRREWDQYGTMGMHGPNRDQMVGIRAMNAEEFKTWFLETMRKRERQILESMVENRVCDCASPLRLRAFIRNRNMIWL